MEQRPQNRLGIEGNEAEVRKVMQLVNPHPIGPTGRWVDETVGLVFGPLIGALLARNGA